MHRIERALLTLVSSGALLFFFSAIETSGAGGAASAQRVEARRASRVFSSPGEQSRVVARVRAGQEVKVLERKGRWLRVRVNGRTGWITRTNVISLDLVATPERKMRRHTFVEGRGRRRVVSGTGPRDRMGADATSAGLVTELPDEARDQASRHERTRASTVRKRMQRRDLKAEEAAELAEELAIDAAGQGAVLPPAPAEPAPVAEPPALPAEPAPPAPPARRQRFAARQPIADDRLPANDEIASEPEVADEEVALVRPAAVTAAAERVRMARAPADRQAGGQAAGDVQPRSVVRSRPGQDAAGALPAEAAVDHEADEGALGDEEAQEREEAEEDADAEEADEVADEEDEEDDEDDEARREYVVVRVARARLYESPTSKSELIDRARAGTRLPVIERSGKWIKVQSQSGEPGWVRASKVDGGDRPVRIDRAEKLAKRASAGLGYTSIGQRFASSSDDPSGAYTLSSGAAVLGIAGELVYAYSESWILAGDLGYRFAYATPGIRYINPETMKPVDIGFKRHQLDLGARAGYALGGGMGMVAYGRLGFHYDNLRINNVASADRNPARLPSEVLRGVTVGAMLDVPRLHERWAARVQLDALPLLANRSQTSGLEDGAASKAFAVWGGALVQYALDDTYRVTGEYQYAYARTSWSGAVEASLRPHGADSARRKDSAHLLMIGVGRAF